MSYFVFQIFIIYFHFFFFFQAEDGIRDHCVTGVQTCALPISFRTLLASCRSAVCGSLSVNYQSHHPHDLCKIDTRSEERRVGKECRYRWTSLQLIKKKEDKEC